VVGLGLVQLLQSSFVDWLEFGTLVYTFTVTKSPRIDIVGIQWSLIREPKHKRSLLG